MTKNISVKKILELINDEIISKRTNEEQKAVLCFMAECLLHETNNYNGFIYPIDYNQSEYTRVYYYQGHMCLSEEGLKDYIQLRKQYKKNKKAF